MSMVLLFLHYGSFPKASQSYVDLEWFTFRGKYSIVIPVNFLLATTFGIKGKKDILLSLSFT